MKPIVHLFFYFVVTALLYACEKKDYPAGLPELEHHYYAVFVPNNNSQVNVQRTQTALVKLPIQFYSNFIRSYDAIARYAVVTEGIANPAQPGIDFDIVDRNGSVIQPVDGQYTLTFPQAKKATDTVYIKLLNNAAPGVRKMEIQLQENQTDAFYVDIFSTAFRRPVEIR